jgi:hypothetical protein
LKFLHGIPLVYLKMIITLVVKKRPFLKLGKLSIGITKALGSKRSSTQALGARRRCKKHSQARLG